MKLHIPEISNRLALICILTVFLLPEIIIWSSVDGFNEPVRAYRGDTAHYMTVLNGALTNGGPEGNSFTFEEQEHGSRFFVFESLVGLMGKVVPISAPVLAIILQVLIPFLIFLIFSSILIALGIDSRLASFVSLLNTIVYGVIAYDGYGLSFWFMPFLLLGIWVLISKSTESSLSPKSGLLVASSILLFTLHPAYFAFGGALTLVTWFILVRKNSLRTVAPYIILWSVLAGILFISLFADMLSLSVAATDTIGRMALVETRFPIHPIQMLELIIVGIVMFLYRKLDVLSASFFIGFLALFAPIITGSYLVNDHYVIAKDYLMLAAALVLIFSENFKKHLWLGFTLLIITIIDFLVVIKYFDFRFGYYGRYALFHSALLIISLVLISSKIKAFLRHLLSLKNLKFLVVILAIVYALFLQYKDYTGAHMVNDLSIQQYRPLFKYLENLPDGVIISNNLLALRIPIFTDQNVYWSSLVLNQPSPTINILKRFEDTHLFFPDDPAHQPPAVASYIFGAIDKCREFNRRHFLKKIASFGFPSPLREMCAPIDDREEKYYLLEDVLKKRYNRTILQEKWQPTFQLDYLVVTKDDKNVPSWLLEKYFAKIGEIDETKIYKYNNK